MTTSSSAALDRDQLIDSHPQAEQIRLVQRTAYQAFSRLHKNGLDALSWILGPMAPFGFAMVDDHREQQARECDEALDLLLRRLGHSVADRRIVALLLEDYPGRHYRFANRLRAHLDQHG